MKKIYLLFMFLFTFSSCKKETNDIDKELECHPICDFRDLNIDEMAKFSFLPYFDGEPEYLFSSRWTWSKSNDTLIIGGGTDFDTFSTQHFFKMKNECVEYLFSRHIGAEDNLQIDENGNYLTPPYYLYDFYNLFSAIQDYDKNLYIIGRVYSQYGGKHDFWVDFNQSNRMDDPYYYWHY